MAEKLASLRKKGGGKPKYFDYEISYFYSGSSTSNMYAWIRKASWLGYKKMKVINFQNSRGNTMVQIDSSDFSNYQELVTNTEYSVPSFNSYLYFVFPTQTSTATPQPKVTIRFYD